MTLKQRIRAARPALRRYRLVRDVTRMAPVRFLLRGRELWRNRDSARRKPRMAAEYLFSGKEVSNFTYPIANTAELEAFVADLLNVPLDRVQALSAELEGDAALRGSLEAKLATRTDREDTPHYGRRQLWYLLLRLEQPKIVVETGIHDGLGSAVMVAALARNAAEGAPGKLHSFDIDPGAGWLVADAPAERFALHRGDIRKTLHEALGASAIDMFIHDSLHTYEHEQFEYDFALEHRAERILLLSDNAATGEPDDMPETTFALRDLCQTAGVPYAVFRERPHNHFVGGGTAGVGVFDRDVS